jgi:hypothetical protein
MESSRREVGVAYTSTPFSLSKNSIVINTVDNYPILNTDKLLMTYNIKDKIIEKCRNKHEDDSFETIIIRNYQYLKIYLRDILKEIIEPFILNSTLHDSDEIVITGLDKIDDQIVNMINIVLDNSNFMYHEHGIRLSYIILLEEQDRF